MKESPNIFILLEGKVLAELKKALEKHADQTVVSDLPVKSGFGADKKDEFNIFALADAVGSRDPFKSWTIYRQAVDDGIGTESILGTLFWQVKSMILAGKAVSAGEAGLSPFVFSKSKKYAGNYSPAELNSFALNLISLYHDSHRGAVDAELALEGLLLRIKTRV